MFAQRSNLNLGPAFAHFRHPFRLPMILSRPTSAPGVIPVTAQPNRQRRYGQTDVANLQWLIRSNERVNGEWHPDWTDGHTLRSRAYITHSAP